MRELYTGGAAGDMIVAAIRRHADRLAIADERQRWTYRDLGQTIGRLISFFGDLGLKKGDAVSVLSGNRVESWAIICAAAIMGLRYTPLHPLAAEDDHAFIVDDAEIDALVVESGKFSERGLAIRARRSSNIFSRSALSPVRAIFWRSCRAAPLRRSSRRARRKTSAGWPIPAARPASRRA